MASAQTTITVDFETANDGYTATGAYGSGTGYVDLFNRTNANLPNCTNEDGYFWGCEDMNAGTYELNLDQIDVTGATEFTFSIDMVAHHFEDWDDDDEILITYSTNGGSTYSNLMWVQMVPSDAFNGPAALDLGFDGDGDCGAGTTLPSLTTGTQHGCTVSSSDFATFSTGTIALSGVTTLNIKLVFNNFVSTDEGVYVDNIVVTHDGGGSSETITTSAISGSPFCVGNGETATVSVPYTITGTFAATNDFTAELSDASGSFLAPTVIGTLSNTNANGTISATIPASVTAGPGYRIRVVGNDPATTGSNNGADLTVNNFDAPSGLGVSCGNTEATVSWSNPGCFDEVMVVASDGAISTTPSGDGTAYTASTTYGSGTAYDGGSVVYKGTGTTSGTITGLTNGTLYNFKIYARKGTNWVTGSTLSCTPANQCGEESFTSLNAPGGSYAAGSYTGDNGVTWSYNEARSVTSTLQHYRNFYWLWNIRY